MKKACVVTYCEWTSYGSIMQAIGLKKTLLQLGVESFIVRDYPSPISEKRFSLKYGWRPRQIVLNTIDYLRRNKQQRLYKETVRFINDNVDVVYYNDYETLKKTPPKADYYIAGSDQIWHPGLCSPLFFLDFVDQNAKRLSYAASMGITKIALEKEQQFWQYVNRFDAISVRENDAAEVIAAHISKDIRVNIDPTFLRPVEEWRALSTEYPIKKPYILVYAIYWDKKLNKQLQELHRKTGFEVVALGKWIPALWATRWVSDADPGQFLWLIDHAQAVVTSSFHGTAFSLIFKKRLAAVVNPAAPSRIDTLLNTTGYSNVQVHQVMDVNLCQYDEVNTVAEEQRQAGIQYLKELLRIDE